MISFGGLLEECLPCYNMNSQEIKIYTFHQNSFGLVHIFEADKQSLSKGINHGEDHPNLNQLDVGGGW